MEKKKALRDWNIHEHDDSGAMDTGEDNLKRVSVECLDMEWVFFNDNAKKLLVILSANANPKVLTKKSIRIFVNLVWT